MAAACVSAAPGASAAIITQTVTATVLADSGDPLYSAGSKFSFQVSWDTAQAFKPPGGPYTIAPMSVYGLFGSDINDGAPLYQAYYETNPFDYYYYYVTPGVPPPQYDPNLPNSGFDPSDFSLEWHFFAAPLVIYDNTGIKGLVIDTDGGSGNNPGFGGGSGVSGVLSCIRPNPQTAYLCPIQDVSYGISTQGNLHGGYYTNTWVGAGPQIPVELEFPTFTQVPEPSTWALAIIGFGFMGARLRASRRTAFAGVGRS